MNAYQRIKWLFDSHQEEADICYANGDPDYRIVQESANAYQYVLNILIEEGLFDENGNSKTSA